MRVEFVGDKAAIASRKHFNNQFNKEEMMNIAKQIISNITHVGTSDRSNGSHAPAKVIWGDYKGEEFALVIDSQDIKRKLITIISFYDVNPTSRDVKLKRFNMKPVKGNK